MRARRRLTDLLQLKYASMFGALAVIALAAGPGPGEECDAEYRGCAPPH